MDEIQKQIIGYWMMTIIGAVIGFAAQKIGIWINDPSTVVMIGVILGAFEVAAYKWIKHTYKIPDEVPPNEPTTP